MTSESVTIAECDRCRQFGDVTDNDVVFDWGLAGPDGAWFTLIREPQHSEADIRAAKHYLRTHRDVVQIYVRRLEDTV